MRAAASKRWRFCWLLAAWLFGAATAAPGAAPADSEYYVKRADWRESMIASREQLMKLEASRGRTGPFLLWISPVVRGGEPARRVSLSVAGAQELCLYVTGAPDPTWGAATWADARVIDAEGNATRINQVDGFRVEEGRHEIDRNMYAGVYGPLSIAGRGFEHGVHVYAYSKLRVPLEGKYERFECWIGLDDWVGPHGAVRFVAADERGAARCDLWRRLYHDFAEALPRRRMQWDWGDQVLLRDWRPGDYGELARRYAVACRRIPPLAAQAAELAARVGDLAGLRRVQAIYDRSRELHETLARAERLNFRALRMAIEDLRAAFEDRYPRGESYLQRLETLQAALKQARERLDVRDLASCERVAKLARDFDRLRREALLDNPLLDFDKLIMIRRTPHGDPRRPNGRGYGVAEYIGLPRQSSKCNSMIEQPFSWENDIVVLEGLPHKPKPRSLYHSEGGRLITDLDLHWDGGKLLFSMPGTYNKWQVWEIGTDGEGLRQVTPGDQPDVDNYDACYLPNDDIVFDSTAPLQGVPCNAGVIVGMLYRMGPNGENIRQLCFDQDHDYNPAVLNDGRVTYLRWDYTDTPHIWNRQVFAMNPDGTQQMEYYASSSYWPNSIFFARPIPNDPTKFVAIVTGHHVGRVGELYLFDPAKAKQEDQGVVQQIPGYGKKVQPRIQDKLTEHSWPKFTHPWPLSDKYFIVAAKPRFDSLWGVYLVDVFDNMVLLYEEEGRALLDPIPLKPRRRPPVIPDRADPEKATGLVYIEDVYQGRALRGVPRGEVKRLRVFTYHFAYQRLAGITHRVGTDGPWECKRVLGTVPVEPDGSALFEIPAKTPISVQPLDEEGKAIQLMRSWMTAQPGETLTCNGCHDVRHGASLSRRTLALSKPPERITPFYGPTRGFSFKREVQPVLDKYCVGCHNGQPWKDGRPIPDLRGDQNALICFRSGDPRPIVVRDTPKEQLIGKYNAIFEPSYIELRRLVRTGGLESDLHELPPLEFHANTSKLVQMLRKGHYNVQLDAEAWNRIITWIDLNAPCHGTWHEFVRIPGDQRRRRVELRKLYGGVVEDGEEIPDMPVAKIEPVLPPPVEDVQADPPSCPNWPLDPAEARRRQRADGDPVRVVDLGDGVKLELVRIPAGSFVMGDAAGHPDERPLARVDIRRPFWMSRFEITNAQFARFDPQHDSRFEHRSSWIFSEEYLGWRLNGPQQPVVRVSWNQAMDFCRWLSERTGLAFTLPTEAQWEYACRAGAASPLWYGDLDADFGPFANMADRNIRRLAYDAWRPKPPDIAPRDDRFNDGALVTANVGSYAPNPWGLYDMHGNAAEWTRSLYRPYPYREDDGRNDVEADGERVVRGGSWYDRPKRCRSAFRLSYRPYQRVFNVSFRVVCESEPPQLAQR